MLGWWIAQNCFFLDTGVPVSCSWQQLLAVCLIALTFVQLQQMDLEGLTLETAIQSLPSATTLLFCRAVSMNLGHTLTAIRIAFRRGVEGTFCHFFVYL